MKRTIVSLIISCQLFFIVNAFAQNSLNIKFTENKRQWDSAIEYRAQLDGGALYLEKGGIAYSFYEKDKLRKVHIPIATDKGAIFPETIKKAAFRIAFVGANSVKPTAEKPVQNYSNYFIGNDQSRWAGGVRSFEKIKYENLYPGINLEMFGMENSIKYNFVVAAKHDCSLIALRYFNLKNTFLSAGNLILQTEVGDIVEQAPYAFQYVDGKKVDVACKYHLEGNLLTFELGKYNHNYDLVIDPVVVFASYSGSLADNFGMTATYDNAGNLFSGGTAFDQGFPYTSGAFDTTYNGIVEYGRTDVVITKYDTTLSNLVYSTYIGGAKGSEIVTSLVVDNQDQLFFYGATGSSDFPFTTSTYDSTFNGGTYLRFIYNGTYFRSGTDIYVGKLSANGKILLGSTYLGGNRNDGVNTSNDTVPVAGIYEPRTDSLQFNYGDQYRGEINLDKSGNPYIASSSRSANFPIVGGFDSSLGGKQDAVVCKFNSNLTQLLWSTFLGGSDNDAGYALTIDDQNSVYVTGGTRSNNFPTTAGVISPTYNGGKADGYITKIASGGTSILHSTYVGTTSYDQSYFIQTDRLHNVYVTGQTQGVFPVTPDTIYSNPNSKQFIFKIKPDFSDTVFSTIFGNGNGQINLSPAAFLVDKCEKVYFSGWGGNIITGPGTFNMPLKTPWQAANPDGFNFYLIVFEKDLDSLVYASYFGGSQSQEHVDGGTSRFDKKGIVYQSVCAGCGGHNDFPTTAGAWSNTNNSTTPQRNCNNGVIKFDFKLRLATANINVQSSNYSGCAPLTIQYNNLYSAGRSYLWDFGGNDTTSQIVNPTKTYTLAGTYLVKLYVFDPLSCNLVDSTIMNITVNAPIVSDFDFLKTTDCSSTVVFDDASGSSTSITNWLWNFGDGESSTLANPTHVYADLKTYTAKLIVTNSGGCKDTAEVIVDLKRDNVSISKDTIVCPGESIQLLATGGIKYRWSPQAGLNNAFIANPIAKPLVATKYTAEISQVKAVGDTCKINLSVLVDVRQSEISKINASAEKDTIVKGEKVMLHVEPSQDLSFNWFPPFSLDNPKSASPIASPEEDTKFYVFVTDQNSCKNIDSVMIFVNPEFCSEENIFIPTAFSPNDDGVNDTLFIRSDNIEDLYFAIYNQWGEIMFETKTVNVGWNGVYKNQKCDPGVFAYYLEAGCINNKKFFKKGNITLLR